MVGLPPSFGVDLPAFAVGLGLPRRLEGNAFGLTLLAIAFVIQNRRNYVVQCAAAAMLGIWLFLHGTGLLLDSRYLKTDPGPTAAPSPPPPPPTQSVTRGP